MHTHTPLFDLSTHLCFTRPGWLAGWRCWFVGWLTSQPASQPVSQGVIRATTPPGSLRVLVWVWVAGAHLPCLVTLLVLLLPLHCLMLLWSVDTALVLFLANESLSRGLEPCYSNNCMPASCITHTHTHTHQSSILATPALCGCGLLGAPC